MCKLNEIRTGVHSPLNNQMKEYLKPTPVIDCDSPSIQEKAKELTERYDDIIEKAKVLFYYTRDEIKYNIYVSKYLPEHFRASNILLNKEGYCVQKAVLFTALARAVGIPAGVGFAKIRNNLLPEKTLAWLGTNILPFHGFSELYLNGVWVKATPSIDLQTCEKGRIIPVEFDGKHDAMFNPYNRDGALHIEYLKYHSRYNDVPLEKLWDIVTQAYGVKFLDPTKYR
jgi:transglutaminase-like putative cysteine protease